MFVLVGGGAEFEGVGQCKCVLALVWAGNIGLTAVKATVL